MLLDTMANMKLVIGSKALEVHLGREVLGRAPADLDIMTPNEITKLPCVEWHDLATDTDKEIYNYCLNKKLIKIEHPELDELHIAPLEILKVLKLSSRGHLNKIKHDWDLTLLKNVELSPELEDLAGRREQEVIKRLDKSRKDFFDVYNIYRPIPHDTLHTYVNPIPAFHKILKKDGVSVCQSRFESLSMEDKVAIVREEVLVLALERQFIPEVILAQSMITLFVDRFQRVETTNDIAYKMLSYFAFKLKDNPEWLAEFAKTHYTDINSGFQEWWRKRVHNLPTEFWSKLLTVAHAS